MYIYILYYIYYIILFFFIYTCLALAFMGGYTPTNRTGGGHRTPPWNKWCTGPALWALIEARVVGMEVGSKISPCFPLGLKEFQGLSFAVPLFHWFSLFLGGRCGSQELDCFSFHVGGFMGGKRRYQLSPKYFKVVIFWRFHSVHGLLNGDEWDLSRLMNCSSFFTGLVWWLITRICIKPLWRNVLSHQKTLLIQSVSEVDHDLDFLEIPICPKILKEASHSMVAIFPESSRAQESKNHLGVRWQPVLRGLWQSTAICRSIHHQKYGCFVTVV